MQPMFACPHAVEESLTRLGAARGVGEVGVEAARLAAAAASATRGEARAKGEASHLRVSGPGRGGGIRGYSVLTRNMRVISMAPVGDVLALLKPLFEPLNQALVCFSQHPCSHG